MASGSRNGELEGSEPSQEKAKHSAGGEYVHERYWASTPEERILACLGYDRIKVSETELEVLLNMTRLVDQVEHTNSYTKSIGRKRCYNRLMKFNFNVDQTVASLIQEEEAMRKPTKRHPASTNSHPETGEELPTDEVGAATRESDVDESFHTPRAKSGEDTYRNPQDHSMTSCESPMVTRLCDPMLSSTPGKDSNEAVVAGHGADETGLSQLESSSSATYTFSGKDNTLTVTLDMQVPQNEGQSVEWLPFEPLNGDEKEDSCDTILDETVSYTNVTPLSFDSAPATAQTSAQATVQASAQASVPGVDTTEDVSQGPNLPQVSYDQNLPPVIFELDKGVRPAPDKTRKGNCPEQGGSNGDLSKVMVRGKGAAKDGKKSAAAKKGVGHDSAKELDHKKLLDDKEDEGISPIRRETEVTNKKDKHKMQEKKEVVSHDVVRGKSRTNISKSGSDTEEPVGPCAENLGSNVEEMGEGEENPEKSSQSSKSSVKGSTKEKRKRRSNLSTKSSRNFIVHGQPREIEETFPLAMTYGTEPKIARLEDITSYIRKYYPSADLSMLPAAMEKGVKSGKWSHLIINEVENAYQLLMGKINPASDSNYEGKICNAILACNTPKCASFQILKGYLMDFHSEMGVTARNNAPLKKALDRAIENNLIRLVSSKARTFTKNMYELVPKFDPSPDILQGDDVENDYLEMDENEKLLWTPVVV